MLKIPKSQLVTSLNRYLEKEVGMDGFLILLYGWFHYRNYGDKYRHAVHARDWLYITEVQDLSDYAGYDLSV